MSVFWSPSPARLYRTLQLADAYTEEQLKEGLDNATVGNLLITDHNNIVPLELQLNFKTGSETTYLFGLNNTDPDNRDSGQYAAAEFQNTQDNRLDDISFPNPFGDS